MDHYEEVDLHDEIDVRGADALEALTLTDRYLEEAVKFGLERVRIIHGIGTGTLRDAIRRSTRAGYPFESPLPQWIMDLKDGLCSPSDDMEVLGAKEATPIPVGGPDERATPLEDLTIEARVENAGPSMHT